LPIFHRHSVPFTFSRTTLCNHRLTFSPAISESPGVDLMTGWETTQFESQLRAFNIKHVYLGFWGWRFGLTLPLFGQEAQAVSADVRSQVEALFLKFQDAYNARDAEGIASTVTQDAVELRSLGGLAIGKQAVVGRFLRISEKIPAKW
jgi:hypothetical protein